MKRTIVALACLLVAGSAAWAEDGQPIRVYTNADLEALPPLPVTQTIRAPRPASEDWKFVLEFIERERKQLDDQRRLRLEQRVVDAELDAMRNRRPSYGLAYAPYTFYPYGVGGNGRRRGHGFAGHGTIGQRSGLRPKQPGGLIKPLYARPGGTIRPIHARPNLRYNGQRVAGRPSAKPGASRGARRR